MLTSVFLCFVLAGFFLVVWTYYQHVKPLTIDTSPAARTATVTDRLLHRQPYSGDTLTESELIHFITVADSVHAYYVREFSSPEAKKDVLDSILVLQRCIGLQEDIKKFIGVYLNQHYITGDEYRLIEKRVLATLHNDWLNRPRTRNERELLGIGFIRSSADTIQRHIDSADVSDHDQRIIREFSRYITANLFPFYIGLTSDSVAYHALRPETKKWFGVQ
ncbi:MAG: hypothetical protein JNL32_10465 [Candidatus Kapabacteria bacterium]|nr:hypothetical protein [Candidatus Kapabacteria bacterium]